MSVQDPVQPPIAFEAIAANIVWQCYLAIDAWQIFCLAKESPCNLLILKAEVMELADNTIRPLLLYLSSTSF